MGREVGCRRRRGGLREEEVVEDGWLESVRGL